jgi:hypothetical protein
MRRIFLIALVLLTCSGCELSLGPRTTNNIVFVRHEGVAARVTENKKVKVVLEQDGKTYEATIDIGGFYVIAPDLVLDKKEIKLPKSSQEKEK